MSGSFRAFSYKLTSVWELNIFAHGQPHKIAHLYHFTTAFPNFCCWFQLPEALSRFTSTLPNPIFRPCGAMPCNKRNRPSNRRLLQGVCMLQDWWPKCFLFSFCASQRVKICVPPPWALGLFCSAVALLQEGLVPEQNLPAMVSSRIAEEAASTFWWIHDNS